MARLKPSDFEYIKKLVAEVETQTTAEIVPLVLKQSNDYRWIHSVMAFEGMLLGFLAAWIWNLSHAWPVSVVEFVVISFGGSFLGLILSFIPVFARFSIGKKRLEREVDSRAFAEFVRQGCSATTNQAGVLILVSLFEHRIEIVADRAVQEKMVAVEGAGIWDSLCKHFSASAAQGKAVEGLGQVIRELGAQLTKHFPDDGSSVNRLSNDLRTDK